MTMTLWVVVGSEGRQIKGENGEGHLEEGM